MDLKITVMLWHDDLDDYKPIRTVTNSMGYIFEDNPFEPDKYVFDDLIQMGRGFLWLFLSPAGGITHALSMKKGLSMVVYQLQAVAYSRGEAISIPSSKVYNSKELAASKIKEFRDSVLISVQIDGEINVTIKPLPVIEV